MCNVSVILIPNTATIEAIGYEDIMNACVQFRNTSKESPFVLGGRISPQSGVALVLQLTNQALDGLRWTFLGGAQFGLLNSI